MPTGPDGMRTAILRRAAITALALAASGAVPALAQVTLRIDPIPVVFASTSGVITSFDVYMDGVPAAGLGSFVIILNEDDPSEITKCLTFDSAALDPALQAAWGSSFSSPIVATDVLTWTAAATGPGRSAPGTVKLGTISYQITSTGMTGACSIGTQHSFSWQGTTRWSETQSPDPGTPFNVLQGAPWVIGSAPDVDLDVTCTRVAAPGVDPNTFDPGTFVDGDTVQLDCQVRNLGTVTPGVTTLIARFSSDLSIDSGDVAIAQVDNVVVAGGATIARTLSGAPFFTAPGGTNICAKVDVNTGDLSDVDGNILETDETNNTFCLPVTVLPSRKDLIVDPTSSADPNVAIVLTPSSVDPNNFHAGLTFQVSFDALNQGMGAVRPPSYRNSVHLGTSLAVIQANPAASFICSKVQPLGGAIPFQQGGTSLTQTFGLDPDPASSAIPADPNEICQISFTQPPGDYVLAVRLDSGNNVVEEDPAGVALPAESNNWASVPIRVEAALPPEFRVREDTTPPIPARIDDLDVLVFDPPSQTAPGRAAISIISAQNVAAYALTFTWSPASFLDVSTDPNAIAFTPFLEQNGRIQTCGHTLDDPNGIITVSCTTVPSADPNVSNAGATTQGHATLLTIQFVPALPGSGTLTTSNLTAANPAGQPIANLSITNGTFQVSGVPKLRVTNAVPPVAIVPGVDFATSYDIENSGFGPAPIPIQSRLVLSQDSVTDPNLPAPDVIACTSNEPTQIDAFSTRQKSLSTCVLLDDALPGAYTGFYQVNATTTGGDPNSWAVVTVPVPSRILALRKSGKGRTAETYLEPDPNGSTGQALASTSKFADQGVSVIGSGSRSLNWMVGLRSSSSSPRKLQVHVLPKSAGEKLDVLTNLRLPKEVRAIFGGADMDGDGEDELIVLRSLKIGDVLDFRRVDFTQRKPLICQSAAITDPNTPPFTGRVVDAAGIEYDGSPGDELAVVTDDGALTIYDLTINGSPPPASPCKPVPAVIEMPAAADILPLASDSGFGAPGDEALSICTLDFQLDGNEEIASLHVDAAGVQALRIYDVPASLGGTVTLLAEDAAFGGTQTRATVLAIACTR